MGLRLEYLTPLVSSICSGKIFEIHFKIFPDNFTHQPLRDLFATLNWYGGISAIIRFHPYVRPFLANDHKTNRFKKSNEIFSLYDRKHLCVLGDLNLAESNESIEIFGGLRIFHT